MISRAQSAASTMNYSPSAARVGRIIITVPTLNNCSLVCPVLSRNCSARVDSAFALRLRCVCVASALRLRCVCVASALRLRCVCVYYELALTLPRKNHESFS